MSELLCVFFRAPELGRCKTRLIAELGAQGALDAHVELLESQLLRGSAAKISMRLWTTALTPYVTALESRFGCDSSVQTGADLGQRMDAALATEFARGAEKVCLIGSDCPAIDGAYLEAGFAALNEVDVVVGPTEDGGYGLIGMKESCSEIFAGIPWGTAQVTEATIARLEAQSLSFRLLPLTWDVDTPEDWRRYEAMRTG